MPKVKGRVEGVGQRIRNLRESRGLSQIRLAEKVGISQSLLSSYEKDAVLPSLFVLVRLAEQLSVSVDELLGVRSTRGMPAMDAATTRLWKKLRRIRRLPERDQRLVLGVINLALRQLRDREEAET